MLISDFHFMCHRPQLGVEEAEWTVDIMRIFLETLLCA